MRRASPRGRTLIAALGVLLLLTARPDVTGARAVANSAPARTPISRAPASDVGPLGSGDPCASESQLEAMLARDPEMARRRAAVEQLILEVQRKGLVPMKSGLPSTDANPVYTIPTVVHIIYSNVNGPENISDPQVQSEIAAVNRDLQNLPANASPANDCQIQLCLAGKDSLGSSANWPGLPGITRHLDAGYGATIAMDVPLIEQTIKGYDYFPSKRYLNVWVVKRITVGGGGGVVGYAEFPGTVSPNLDGIVMDYRVMGANNTGFGTFASLLPSNDQGKVFTHEVGHYLDIYHTFHGGCAIGDLVNDTPWEANNFWGCPQGSPTTICNSITYPAPIHNFMDYTDDPCRWEFTAGQQVRMFAALSSTRAQLVDVNNLISVGACPPSVFAFITPSQKQQCIGQPISFSAPACTGSCSYTWTFQDGSGNTTTQNTSATFSSTGPKLVTLSVSNGSQTSNTSITVFITACSPIAGPCTNWVFGNKARLDFSTGLPVAVAGTRNNGTEAATQLSSNAGSLLFYTDNDTIWNASNQIMAGGGATQLRGRSSHTGALAIPRPNAANQYYLLSVLEAEQWGGSKPIFAMSTINMSLNGGLGGVTAINTPINLPIAPPFAPTKLIEGVTALPQCNGNDWWVITCGADSNDANFDWERFLYVTPVTNAGAGITQEYPLGFFGPNPGGLSGWGSLTASRDGEKLAICQAGSREVHIYTFDRAAGVPTLTLNTGNISANQDVEFSPDGKLIYYCYIVGQLLDGSGNGNYGIRQMDLASGAIRTLRAPTGVSRPFDLQLGPDDKIYVARPGAASLDVINFPNTLNSSATSNECGYNPDAIPLGSGVVVNQSGALPNTISMCNGVTVPPASFTYKITNCKTVTFHTPNCGPWDWNFGDGNQLLNASTPTVVHTYTNTVTTTFNVTLTASSASPPVATMPVTIGALAISITGPGSACGGPLNYTVVGPSSYTYVWTITGGSPPSATGNNVFVSWGLGSSATIQVTGTDPATGCTSTFSKSVDPCVNCTPPPANMVAWWPLDESAGSTAQELVNARDGTDVGAPAKLPGAVSNARQFSGTGQYVRVNDDAKLDLGTGNLTIDAWIRTSSNPTYAGIVEKRSLSPDLGYALYLKNGQLAFLLGDGTTSTEFVATNGPNLIDGFWHHVAATEDRNNTNAGTVLYVDGAPVNVLPAFTGNFSLDNAEKLLIGAQEPSSSPTSLWVGGIDEVEIFTRALGSDEVAKIYGAGAGGKCKEYVYAPTAQTICQAQIYTDVTFYICNATGASQSYALSFAGTTGAGCTIAGPTSFTILSANTNGVVTVGTGCQPVIVRIVKPNGMISGDVACYTITAVNTSSNISRTTNASIWASDAVCPRATSQILTAVGVGVVVPHTFQIQNSSPAPENVTVQVQALGVDQPILVGGGVVSLNGLPPGVPWQTTFALAPGESTLVHVDAQFTDAAPFVPYDILLAADVDGNGTPDAETAAGMVNSEPPLHVVGVPPAATVLPARFELVSAAPNPFHRLLTVELELPRASRVTLELFDVSGRRVRRAAETVVAPGRALRVLDAGGLHSGVYVLRVGAGGEVRSRSVVLLKE